MPNSAVSVGQSSRFVPFTRPIPMQAYTQGHCSIYCVLQVNTCAMNDTMHAKLLCSSTAEETVNMNEM